MKVLLSIKPEYADKILSGEKRFEFRKSIFKRDGIRTVIIYATMPVGKVIGEFEIETILSDRPDSIWDRTSQSSGITKDFFDSYFSERSKAYAIEVKSTKKYSIPQDLSEIKIGLKAPQSFAYV
ncbi:ASCH domain-containing protein [Acinetobacter sp. ANC5681]|uniref:ASCH domain-containing protein n=1 Tax=Acinetobacter sp. ANC5681 TaxID=2929504 RepID=UPI00201B24CC|nr:ASCH domain-containing protein [Acinetobacter sp. ANC5681]MCL5769684.1 ASCH domain-containing protein [Acinetobacter sp. ANC5681]